MVGEMPISRQPKEGNGEQRETGPECGSLGELVTKPAKRDASAVETKTPGGFPPGAIACALARASRDQGTMSRWTRQVTDTRSWSAVLYNVTDRWAGVNVVPAVVNGNPLLMLAPCSLE